MVWLVGAARAGPTQDPKIQVSKQGEKKEVEVSKHLGWGGCMVTEGHYFCYKLECNILLLNPDCI